MSKREFDPLGRDALFLPPQSARPAPPQRQGRDALFSGPERRPGDAVIECSACGGRTPVRPTALPRRLLPSLFVPFRRHPHFLRCPACHRPSWCRVQLR